MIDDIVQCDNSSNSNSCDFAVVVLRTRAGTSVLSACVYPKAYEESKMSILLDSS